MMKVISPSAKLGDNVCIGFFTVYITAYTNIGEHCFIAPMVTTTNDNFMGRTQERFKHISGANIQDGARVGGGSILLPGVTVAEESFIAAGAVVTKDTIALNMALAWSTVSELNPPTISDTLKLSISLLFWKYKI